MLVGSKEIRKGNYETVTVLDTDTGLVYKMRPDERNVHLTINSLHAPKVSNDLHFVDGEAFFLWKELFWDHKTDQVRDLVRATWQESWDKLHEQYKTALSNLAKVKNK
jgi:hypothetical protein